jgi:hypothetical protein
MQIIFEFQTAYGLFRDALHLPDDHGLSNEQIDAMKQDRINNWVAAITAPPIEEVADDFIEIDGVSYAKVSGNG